MCHGLHKLEKRRGVALHGFCWLFCSHVEILLCDIIFPPRPENYFSPRLIFSYASLCSVLSWPVKNDTLPLSPCSYCRIEDGPSLLPHSASWWPKSATLAILTKVFSADPFWGGCHYSSLSLEHCRMHLISQNRHRKQLYGVQLSGWTAQRQMAVNWLTSLRKYREIEVQAQNSRKAKGQKGVIFACVTENDKLISGSRKPPFHMNIDFSEHLNGWH